MAYFATEYVYGPADEQEKHRPAHREYLATLVEEGKLAASGPFNSGAAGALLIFVGESEEDIIALIEKDPMRIGGVVLSYSIREWNPVMGKVGS